MSGIFVPAFIINLSELKTVVPSITKLPPTVKSLLTSTLFINAVALLPSINSETRSVCVFADTLACIVLVLVAPDTVISGVLILVFATKYFVYVVFTIEAFDVFVDVFACKLPVVETPDMMDNGLSILEFACNTSVVVMPDVNTAGIIAEVFATKSFTYNVFVTLALEVFVDEFACNA